VAAASRQNGQSRAVLGEMTLIVVGITTADLPGLGPPRRFWSQVRVVSPQPRGRGVPGRRFPPPTPGFPSASADSTQSGKAAAMETPPTPHCRLAGIPPHPERGRNCAWL
jgi:hypothetical protein